MQIGSKALMKSETSVLCVIVSIQRLQVADTLTEGKRYWQDSRRMWCNVKWVGTRLPYTVPLAATATVALRSILSHSSLLTLTPIFKVLNLKVQVSSKNIIPVKNCSCCTIPLRNVSISIWWKQDAESSCGTVGVVWRRPAGVEKAWRPGTGWWVWKKMKDEKLVAE
jgi:hypothetical protein